MTAYYNEIDPFAAEWLRCLILEGHIAEGDVDTRSIEDVCPDDLRSYSQCHFFAGIGVWSYALRQAGWGDDRPIWTGSCPCQPFSAAGQGGGFADERHLWPHWQWLIRECRPPVIAGEQVASKSAEPWIDLVHADLEALGYAFGCVPFPAAGVGAPHIRDRTYWVAYADSGECDGIAGGEGCLGDRTARGWIEGDGSFGCSCLTVGLDHHHHQGSQRHTGHGDGSSGRPDAAGPVTATGISRGLVDADQPEPGSQRQQRSRELRGSSSDQGTGAASLGTSPTNGLRGDADWIFCRDGKWRPVESGTFPLAHGAPARVGRLRGYGNAIVAPQAQAFIEAVMEIL